MINTTLDRASNQQNQGCFNSGRTSHIRISALDYKQYQVLKVKDYNYQFGGPHARHIAPLFLPGNFRSSSPTQFQGQKFLPRQGVGPLTARHGFNKSKPRNRSLDSNDESTNQPAGIPQKVITE